MSTFTLSRIVFELDWMKITNNAIKLQNTTQNNVQQSAESLLLNQRDNCLEAYCYLMSLKHRFSLRNELDVVEAIQKNLLILSKCLILITTSLITLDSS